MAFSTTRFNRLYISRLSLSSLLVWFRFSSYNEIISFVIQGFLSAFWTPRVDSATSRIICEYFCRAAMGYSKNVEASLLVFWFMVGNKN